MRQKQSKNYFKFDILLFGILMLCYTCQKDDAVPSEEPALAFKLKVINYAEVTKNKNVNAIIDAFPKS
ncbi:hypothetical protein DFQ10_103117 [Winogradskyella eximia]|uniref:Uncharacterized protein n=1 Tax=Winogradskyella eximia TaxID=262006 RepID=A0A3D9H4J7_9FLAO|nr:hypothetical protein [Winogradskyella eximia]RED44433.1 hypothetical protein DFQ10_103117 [Winogradskyella eximia]